MTDFLPSGGTHCLVSQTVLDLFPPGLGHLVEWGWIGNALYLAQQLPAKAPAN